MEGRVSQRIIAKEEGISGAHGRIVGERFLWKIILSLLDSFLPDLDRIATREYEPADDDILRARLRTVGIQEYKLHMGGSNCKLMNDLCR